MSNLRVEEKEIDGIRFTTQQYAAMRGLELLGKLAKTIGPAMGAIANGTDLEGDDFEKAAPMIGMALRDLQPHELSALVLDILKGTTATISEAGNLRRVDLLDQAAIDKVFSGRLMVMFKVVLHALKVNYSDFGFGSAQKKESAPETP